jgi:hypothetical protein
MSPGPVAALRVASISFKRTACAGRVPDRDPVAKNFGNPL